MDKDKRILIISSDKNLRDVLNFCFDGWGYEVFLQEAHLRDITPIKKMAPDAIVVDVHSASKHHLELCRLLKDDFLTASIPMITLINKRQLRGQLLDLKHAVDDYLIKPPDPLDLRVRIEMAIKRSQHSFFVSSLTGLPGGGIIEEVLRERIQNGAPFAFGYVDIDNFKYFNDVYGYLKGDRVIMQTAYMLYTVIRRFGKSDDFIGHIGGDDFVFITSPERSREVAAKFIEMFDRIIPFHYSEKDRDQGYIVARDRARTVNKVALMSVSVAVVSRRDETELKNVIEINERVAEIKRYLKGIGGSKFMADRRNTRLGQLEGPHAAARGAAGNSYKPLGQILLERSVVSPEELDSALKTHWKRGVTLGETLRELGLIEELELEDALKAQGLVPQNA